MNRLKHEFFSHFLFFISIIPGNIGIEIRKIVYIFFFSTKTKVHIEKYCEFLNTSGMSFGNNVIIGKNSFFTTEGGGEIYVGNDTSFNMNVHINASSGGRINIGKDCLFGPNVVIRTANHKFLDINIPIRKQGHKLNDIFIEEDVWLGSNVIILGGVTVGRGSVIAAGAVVTKNIPSYSVAGGIPAKIIKSRINSD